jgi:eukaryotic-like serine/threonine-protein kinase
MDADRWSRIQQLYHEAAALDDSDRAAFLARVGREDHTLRAEIESLLADDDLGESFLEEPAIAVAARLVGGNVPGLTGQAFGPYRIEGLLGAGGMGDVYGAHDTVLGRDVAIKILPEAFTDDAERLARFKQEAQFLASLSHPNVAAIYGVHESDGLRGLVLELVDGETLTQRIQRGPIPLNEAVRIARQIGEGLDAAHQRGIVHRDLKPSNIKIARDGTTKILDFGLAKSVAADGSGAGGNRESSAMSDGLVVGTASYMSPEQARGDAVDKRADIWAFGCVCFEMLTGQPAFRRKTPDSQLDAAGPRWDLMPRSMPAGITALLKRCLEDGPRRRRRDVGDVLADLDDALRGDGAVEKPGRGWRPLRATMLGLAVVATAFLTGWAVRGGTVVDRELPVWRKLTFDEGMVHTARFGPDGQTVLYSASWGGKPFQVFSTTTLSPESRALDLPPAGLLSVSRSGQLLLALSCVYVASRGGCDGTLARAPLLGGAPRALAENVLAADWGPGDTLAAVVANRLEFPLGNAVADRAGAVRVSPDGGRLASAERVGDSWVVAVRSGQTRQVVSQGWTFVSGLAWVSDGTALFVSGMGGPGNNDDGVSRIEMDGTSRTVLRSRPRIRVLDAAPDDRLLIDHSDSGTRAWVHDANAPGGRRDLTWLGSSVVDAISHDGRKVLLTVRTGATLEGGRPLRSVDLYPIYVRPTDGGPAALLGNGYGHALSDDGRWALTSTRENRESKVILYPLGPGPVRTLDNAGLDMSLLANTATNVSFAGSSRIVFVARRDDGPLMTYVQAIAGGPPMPVEHEPGHIVSPVAPDGERFVSQRPDGSLWLATLEPGAATRLPFTLQQNQFIRQWSADGRQVFILTLGSDRWVVTRVDLKTGSVQPHREIMRDPLEDQMFASAVRISRDGAVIAGTGSKTVSSLFLIEGVR